MLVGYSSMPGHTTGGSRLSQLHIQFAQHHPFCRDGLLIGSMRIVHHAHPYRFLAATPGNDLEALLFAKRGEISAALSPCVVDQIPEPMRMQQVQVLTGGDAGIHDHQRFLSSVGHGGIQLPDHFHQTLAVVEVALEDLVRHLETELVEHHADDNLRTIVALLFVCAAFGLRVSLAQPFEMRVGQIIQQHRTFQVEQTALTLTQVPLDLALTGQQQIADPIKPVVARPA